MFYLMAKEYFNDDGMRYDYLIFSKSYADIKGIKSAIEILWADWFEENDACFEDYLYELEKEYEFGWLNLNEVETVWY